MRSRLLRSAAVALSLACGPGARVAADVEEGALPLTVRLSGASAAATWDLGDGAVAAGAAVTHTYVASGTYTATASWAGAGGRPREASVEIVVRLEDCPRWDEASTPTSVDDLVEASGLAAGLGVLWTHNDSGDGPHLLALGEDGADRGGLTLEGAPSRDWEDLAAWGPMLVVADTGDNARAREDVQLLLVADPGDPLGADWSTRQYTELPLLLPEPADIEAVAVDPRTDALVLLTKDADGAVVYAAEGRWWEQAAVAPEAVAALDLGGPDLPGSPLATGLDIDPAGHRVVVQTHSGPWLFRRDGGAAWDAFASAPCELPGHVEQNEAIAISGERVWTLPEGSGAPLRTLVERSPPR